MQLSWQLMRQGWKPRLPSLRSSFSRKSRCALVPLTQAVASLSLPAIKKSRSMQMSRCYINRLKQLRPGAVNVNCPQDPGMMFKRMC